MLVNIVGDAYKVRTPNLNAQTCINLYPVLDKKHGKTITALYPTPGKLLFSSGIAGEECRQLYESNYTLYAVIGHKFYEVDSEGNRVEKGELLTGTGPVTIISNGLQIMIVDGVNQYVFTLATNTFQVNPSVNFQGCNIATYQDGYGIIPVPNSTTWYITDLFDFSVINALEFASANTDEQWIISTISKSQEVWLLKRNSTEIWYDTGNADFPFQRRQTLIMRYGCAAAYSLVKMDSNTLFWLARNEHAKLTVVRLDGYESVQISNDAIETAMSSYTVIDDAIGYVDQGEDGHLFYILTFPTADRTWVYDISTDLWHERRSELNNKEPFIFPTRQGRDRGNCYTSFAGKRVVGDFETGNLYLLDDNINTENEIFITRERTTCHVSEDERFVFIENFQLIAETGVGLNDGEGSDPQIMLQVSKNGGHTFGVERWRSLGRQGYYKHRVKWNALGASRDWVFRLRIRSPIKVFILGARADIQLAKD